jgi:inosine triphosphate pyrophosphatase
MLSELAPSTPITFVTGNAGKLAELKAILHDLLGTQLPLDAKRIDLPELQGDPELIVREKCRQAAGIVQGPVLVEDTQLCFHAFGGLPGPYIKYFLQNLGPDGVEKMLLAWDDKRATAQCLFALALDSKTEPEVFCGQTQGHIVPPRGKHNFGWDPIFQPEGSEKTYAEMSEAEKNVISHRYRAAALLAKALSKTYQLR